MKLGNGNKAIMKRLSGRSTPFKQFCGDSDIKPDLLGYSVCVHWRSRTVDVVCVTTGTWLRGPSPGSLSWRPGPVQPWTWENEGRDNNTPTLWPTLHNNTSLLSFNPVCPRIVTKMTERRLARRSCRLGLTRRMLNEAESLHPSDPASLPPRIINQELSTLGN